MEKKRLHGKVISVSQLIFFIATKIQHINQYYAVFLLLFILAGEMKLKSRNTHRVRATEGPFASVNTLV